MRCSRARRAGRDGEKASIIAFQNTEYYYLLPVAHVLGGRVVQGGRHSEHRGREGFVDTMPGFYATTAAR
jgi:hypothetical protein